MKKAAPGATVRVLVRAVSGDEVNPCAGLERMSDEADFEQVYGEKFTRTRMVACLACPISETEAVDLPGAKHSGGPALRAIEVGYYPKTAFVFTDCLDGSDLLTGPMLPEERQRCLAPRDRRCESAFSNDVARGIGHIE